MALISCPECSKKISDKAISCPSCGRPLAKPEVAENPTEHAPRQIAPTVALAKSRSVHIILGLMFGGLGFHNFDSGRNLIGGIKTGLILVTLFLDALTGFYSKFSFVLLVLFTLWSLGEIIVVQKDAAGIPMV